jgi:hypothetical protein
MHLLLPLTLPVQQPTLLAPQLKPALPPTPLLLRQHLLKVLLLQKHQRTKRC